MKTRTTFAIAAIALTLGNSLQAAPKKNRENHDAATQQIERGFDAIGKAVADARKQATGAVTQRDAALKALQDEKTAAEKSRKQMETGLAEANRKLAVSTKQIADLGNGVKAAEASRQATEKQLAETRQKLEQANKALTVQLKTIADAKKSAVELEKKHSETLKNLKTREAGLEKPRKEMNAKKGRTLPGAGN